MSGRGRLAGIALWWLALALAAFAVQHTLVVSNDLRSFMPPPRNADQKVLMDEIGDGPASRLLLMAISGAPSEKLATLSRGLVHALRADTRFTQALNGSESFDQLDAKLLPYRYLLSPTLDRAQFDAPYLREQLEERLQDLGSPAASSLEDILPRDPTLETLVLAQRWIPRHAPALRDGVWFSPHKEALLVATTRAPGLDTAAQSDAIVAVRAAFAALPGAANARLDISGAGYIGARIAASTRAEAERLSAVGTAGFAILLLLAYRSASILALVALPLASGALAGLAAIVLVFGNVHGITLAFGFTLLGVAQEYPIRVFSHRRAGSDSSAGVRGVWPLLRLAIVSACIAYLAFLVSGVPGLQQLAVFTIVALLVAGAATRWLLPPLLPDRFRDVAAAPVMQRAQRWLAAMPRPRALPWIALALALLALWFAPAPLWQNDLSALAPAPPAELVREGKLRAALGAPDVRHLLVLHADSADAVENWLAGAAAEAPSGLEVIELRSANPDDLTLREARLLGTADVLLVGQGIPQAILDRARADAVRRPAPHDGPVPPGLTVELRRA